MTASMNKPWTCAGLTSGTQASDCVAWCCTEHFVEVHLRRLGVCPGQVVGLCLHVALCGIYIFGILAFVQDDVVGLCLLAAGGGLWLRSRAAWLIAPSLLACPLRPTACKGFSIRFCVVGGDESWFQNAVCHPIVLNSDPLGSLARQRVAIPKRVPRRSKECSASGRKQAGSKIKQIRV